MPHRLRDIFFHPQIPLVNRPFGSFNTLSRASAREPTVKTIIRIYFTHSSLLSSPLYISCCCMVRPPLPLPFSFCFYNKLRSSCFVALSAIVNTTEHRKWNLITNSESYAVRLRENVLGGGGCDECNHRALQPMTSFVMRNSTLK